MNLALLVDGLYVSNQLQKPEDLAVLVDVGVKKLMCNRPDAEEENQASFAQVKEWAEAQGIEVVHLPVVMNNMGLEEVHRFGAWLQENAGTTKAVYCRTGTRSSLLWALSQVEAGHVGTVEAIKTVTQAGRNISGAAMMLQQLEPQ